MDKEQVMKQIEEHWEKEKPLTNEEKEFIYWIYANLKAIGDVDPIQNAVMSFADDYHDPLPEYDFSRGVRGKYTQR